MEKMKPPQKICHRMMNAVWLINALENALHEPNSLLTELLQEGGFESLSSLRLNSDERAYLIQSLKNSHERLTKTRELLNQFDISVLRTESSLVSSSLPSDGQ
jgi:hypothetical protein